MADKLTLEEKAVYGARYKAAAHAVQSGVAMAIAKFGEARAAANSKHLRVGVNMAMVEHSALAMLLMEKGVITEREYHEALVKGIEAEKERHEKRLSENLGFKVVLA